MWKEEEEKQTEKNDLSSHSHQDCYHKKQVKQKITSVHKKVEKLELLCTVDGNANGAATMEKQHGSPSKILKIKLSYDSLILLI